MLAVRVSANLRDNLRNQHFNQHTRSAVTTHTTSDLLPFFGKSSSSHRQSHFVWLMLPLLLAYQEFRQRLHVILQNTNIMDCAHDDNNLITLLIFLSKNLCFNIILYYHLDFWPKKGPFFLRNISSKTCSSAFRSSWKSTLNKVIFILGQKILKFCSKYAFNSKGPN